MNTDKHTVTIPIEDYNKMLELHNDHEKFIVAMASRLELMKFKGVYVEGLNFTDERQDLLVKIEPLLQRVSLHFIDKAIG